MAKNKRHNIKKIANKKLSKNAYNDNQLFRWSLKQCHFDDILGKWNELTAKEFIQEIIVKLEDYSSQTWHEVKTATGGKATGTNNHFISIKELDKTRYKYMLPLHGNNKEECSFDEVFSLRLTAKRRLIGYVKEHIFYPLWHDPEHDIIKSRKRHT